MLNVAALVILLSALAYCFTPEETEIFELQRELAKKYGDEIDFYRFLKLPKLKHSSSKEIVRNLRNLAKKYHPDKNRKYKKLYERLNKATEILSNDSRRKTYDYYLKNGFPDYNFSRGGFIFRRVQPKTWFLVLFLYVVASAIHYALLKIQHTSNKRRIQGFIRQCKEQDDTNGVGEKRLVFKQHEADDAKEILIRLGDVYVVQPDGEMCLISADDAADPTILDCLFFRLPMFLWNRSLGRLFIRAPSQPSTQKEANSSDKRPQRAARNVEAKLKDGQKKMTLPNGKVIYSRKKE
ncbi:hypothetical protein HG536_0D05780 [Torulaspora globosa]|uniref:J domain-containing protein n=1 Tax=Torulaspora globosa TaxID=48254 RepID=A0A7G3ZHS1_9SACH|nr:uncharacterized protein HG536_0D05780 [Torulaspora globosa]QLL33057.1 hypothetical protein HG536_0D05780 [Torulaspora globosa]